jgi:hypothetical protein
VCVGVIHPSGRPACVPPSFATAQLFKCGRDLSRVVGCWRMACGEKEKSGEAGDLFGCVA